MSLKVNDKVVCVDDRLVHTYSGCGPALFDFPGGPLIKGEIYVVSGFSPHALSAGVTITGKPVIMESTDIGWSNHRFRKLDEIQQENHLRLSQSEPACV